MICTKNSTFSMPGQLGIDVNFTFNFLIAFIAIFGNLTIVILFIRFKDLRNMNNAAITVLSCSDFFRGCIIMPLKLYNQSRFAGSTSNPHIDEPICSITAFLCGFTFVFSPMMLAFIAVIRYYIIKPGRYGKNVFSNLSFVGIISVVFTIAVLFSSLPMMGVGHFRYSQSHGVCFVDWCDDNRVFRIVFYVINIFVVFPILCSCYGALFFALKRHSNHMRASIELGTPKPEKHKMSVDQNLTLNTLPVIAEAQVIDNENSDEYIAIQKKRAVTYTVSNNSVTEVPGRPKASSVLSNTSNKASDRISSRESRITKIVLIIFVAYVICWMPAAILNILAIADITNINIGWFYLIIDLVDMKSAIDPLLYGLGNPAYWKAFRELIRL